MAFYCYILKCANGAYYTGWTVDPVRRLKQHNAGKGAQYTRMNRPVKLVYVEKQTDKSTALKREREIKKWHHDRKEKLVEQNPLSPEYEDTLSDKR